jgi:ribosomal protein S27E
MWIMYKVDAAKVQSYVGKYITQAECGMILATPQGGLSSVTHSFKSIVTLD